MHVDISRFSHYICQLFFGGQPTTTGRSAVRLAHLPWEQGVGGSNPLAPTSLRP